jgi:hypothetical protein
MPVCYVFLFVRLDIWGVIRCEVFALAMTLSITEEYKESNLRWLNQSDHTFSLQFQVSKISRSDLTFDCSRRNNHHINVVILQLQSKRIAKGMNSSFSRAIYATPRSRLVCYHTADIDDFISRGKEWCYSDLSAVSSYENQLPGCI